MVCGSFPHVYCGPFTQVDYCSPLRTIGLTLLVQAQMLPPNSSIQPIVSSWQWEGEGEVLHTGVFCPEFQRMSLRYGWAQSSRGWAWTASRRMPRSASGGRRSLLKLLRLNKPLYYVGLATLSIVLQPSCSGKYILYVLLAFVLRLSDQCYWQWH